jgi:hypothetical protein
VLDLSHVDRAAVRPAEAEVAGAGAQDGDLAQDLRAEFAAAVVVPFSETTAGRAERKGSRARAGKRSAIEVRRCQHARKPILRV